MLTSGARLVHSGLVVLLAGATACGGRAAASSAGEAPRPARSRAGAPLPAPDPVELYRSMGLIAHGAPMPLTGRVSYVASGDPDTTFVLVTLALPSRALTFSHTGDRYQAAYRVEADVRQGGRETAALSAEEQVVVPNFRETTRGDESVLFQQVLRLAPGVHDMVLRVRDQGSDRAVVDTVDLRVPRLGVGTLGSPIPYYEVVLRSGRAVVPRLLVTPRATVTFGRDSVLPIYLEGYDRGPQTVHALVSAEVGGDVWRDSLTLQPRGEGDSLAVGVLELPVTRLGIGAVTLRVWRPGATDSVRTAVFVSFGSELPVGSFEDMLSYLRYFTAPQRLERLRATPVAERGRAWSQFLAETDPSPELEGHQGLQQYFARIQVANQRYRDDGGPGWLSDRGMAFVAFGDPDQVYEPNPMAVGQRNRQQIWIYRDEQLQLEYRDVNGFERWEMQPASEAAFQMALRRLHGG